MAEQSPLATTLSQLDARVIETSPVALCMCSAPHGEIVRYNTLAVRLWGRTPDPGERQTGAWRTRFPDGRLMAYDESAMDAVLRGSVPIQHGTGLGIGLSVVREIVALHGGNIGARSEGAWKRE